MKINVIPTAKDLQPEETMGKAVVILDILRATTTITTAFEYGCKRIIPAYCSLEALNLKVNFPNAFLGGEIEGDKIPGFDFGNSPKEYTSENIKESTIILATTNGTKAIVNSRQAELILIGSLLNISSLVNKLKVLSQDIVIACAGTQGTYSLEDTYVAGQIISMLSDQGLNLTDSSLGALALYHYYSTKMENPLSISRNGKALSNKNRQDDIYFCSQVDFCSIVPFYDRKEHNIKVFPGE